MELFWKTKEEFSSKAHKHESSLLRKHQIQVKIAEKEAWKKKKMIYGMLRYHYMLRKSVIFIVDTEYSSVVYQAMANKFIKNQFRELDD